MKNKTLKKILSIAFVLAVVGISSPVAYANPIYAGPTVQTATATTSPRYLTPGTGTTTLVFDSYNPATNRYLATKVMGLLQFAASNTASTLGIATEYSADGIDWYQGFMFDPSGISTTSPVMTLGAPNRLSWQFASTTLNGVAKTNANSATSSAAVIIPSPLRFLRLVVSITGGNGAFWGQVVPIKEQ